MLEPAIIFISYRRADSQPETERIYDRLVLKFGRKAIFKDVDDIPPGVDFAEHIELAIRQCQVLIAVIGKHWASTLEDSGQHRLHNPDDFVRLEIETALKLSIPVIPVLIEGAVIPNQTQLPVSLHPLLRLNFVTIGYDPRFEGDFSRLVKGIQGFLEAGAANRSPIVKRSGRALKSSLGYPRAFLSLRLYGFACAIVLFFMITLPFAFNSGVDFTVLQNTVQITRDELDSTRADISILEDNIDILEDTDKRDDLSDTLLRITQEFREINQKYKRAEDSFEKSMEEVDRIGSLSPKGTDAEKFINFRPLLEEQAAELATLRGRKDSLQRSIQEIQK